MPRRIRAPAPALFPTLPDELVLRILSMLAVEELPKACVNRRFRHLFHDPSLWKPRVEAMLATCTQRAQLAVQKLLSRDCYLWSEQLRHDHDWCSRMALVADSEARAFRAYGRAGAYKKAYEMISRFEMVSVRQNSGGAAKLATIPFTQSIRNVTTGESINVFTVRLITERYFVAVCQWNLGLYDILLNDEKMENFFFMRPGDVLKMVRKKTGKTRSFSLLLGIESEIPG